MEVQIIYFNKSTWLGYLLALSLKNAYKIHSEAIFLYWNVQKTVCVKLVFKIKYYNYI